MLNPHFIQALVADRERRVADHQRSRQVSRRPLVRWIRRPATPHERR